jgi:hypothetical protein
MGESISHLLNCLLFVYVHDCRTMRFSVYPVHSSYVPEQGENISESFICPYALTILIP